MKFFSCIVIIAMLACSSSNQTKTFGKGSGTGEAKLKTGADQTEKYLSYLKGKRVAILANQTAIIGHTHLVDSLKSLGINIIKVFGPEHGFRGNASAGAVVSDE